MASLKIVPCPVLAAAFAALALTGCSGFGAGESLPPAVAAATPAPPPAAAAPVAPVATSALPPPSAAGAAAPAQPIPCGAALGGSIGASLSDADREAAWKAEVAALDSGQRHSWHGPGGVFGFIEPGAETGAGCRAFARTIYIAGRPKRGQGVACKQSDGTWKVAG